MNSGKRPSIDCQRSDLPTQHAPKQHLSFNLQRPFDADELRHIQPALPCFDLRNRAAVPPEAGREILLSHLRFAPAGGDDGHHGPMPGDPASVRGLGGGGKGPRPDRRAALQTGAF
jgi:hypothetical protein